MGVGPRRSRRVTWPGPRSRCRSSARTAMPSTGSSPARPRRAGRWSCGPMPRACPTIRRRASSIRSRVNEYGGGALCLVPGRSAGAFAYVDQADQRVWFCDGAGRRATSGGATPVALSAPPPAGEVHRHGGLSATADGEWVLAVREVHHEGSARPRAQRGRPVDPRRGAVRDARCSTGTTSSARRGRIRPATASPWSPGTIRTCRGTPRPCWSCRSAGSPAPQHGHDVLQAAGPAQHVAGGAGRVGRPAGLERRRVVALRLGPARAGGSPTVTRGPPGSGRGAHAADRQWRPSSTGRIGCSASRPWRRWPTGRSSPG